MNWESCGFNRGFRTKVKLHCSTLSLSAERKSFLSHFKNGLKTFVFHVAGPPVSDFCPCLFHNFNHAIMIIITMRPVNYGSNIFQLEKNKFNISTVSTNYQLITSSYFNLPRHNILYGYYCYYDYQGPLRMLVCQRDDSSGSRSCSLP